MERIARKNAAPDTSNYDARDIAVNAHRQLAFTIGDTQADRTADYHFGLFGKSSASETEYYSLRTYKVYEMTAKPNSRFETAGNVQLGQWKYYKVTVPTGKNSMSVTVDYDILNTEIDVDLYMQSTNSATPDVDIVMPRMERSGQQELVSVRSGNSESMSSITVSAGDTWYIGVRGRVLGRVLEIEADLDKTGVYESEAEGNPFRLSVAF